MKKKPPPREDGLEVVMENAAKAATGGRLDGPLLNYRLVMGFGSMTEDSKRVEFLSRVSEEMDKGFIPLGAPFIYCSDVNESIIIQAIYFPRKETRKR